MPLQRSFTGMSDHIGRYEGGNVRQELSPLLQPVISAEDWINPYEFIRAVATLTAQGQAIVIPVPAGELWRIRSAHLKWSNPSGLTSVQAVINPDGVGLVGLENSDFITISAGTAGYAAVTLSPDPIVMKGAQSAQIGYLMTVQISGSTTAELVVSRQRIKI
jgi:hypothetical protein